jgi:hypothetical protein
VRLAVVSVLVTILVAGSMVAFGSPVVTMVDISAPSGTEP